MTRLQYALIATILASLLLVWARFDEFAVGSMADDAVYAELARSISEGRGPVLHLGPGPSSVAAGSQPSGYPLLISPVAYLFPDSIEALKLASACFFFALMAVYYALLRPVAEPSQRLALIAVVFLNPWTIAYANRVFSEMAYMLVSFSGVLLYDRWLRGRKMLDLNLAGLVLCLALSAAIRTIGFSLLVAVALHLGYKRDWRRLGLWASCQLLPLTLLMAFTRSSGGGFVPRSYLVQIVGFDTALLERLSFMAWTLFYYLKELAALTLPVFGQAAEVISTQMGWGGLYAFAVWTLGGGVLLVSLGGILHAHWRQQPGLQLLCIYQLVFLAVLCNWTFIPVDRPGGWVELRLLLPLLPAFYLFALGGLQALGQRLGNLSTSRVAALFLLLVLPLSLAHNAYRIKVPFKKARTSTGRGFIDFSAGSQWFKENAEPGAIVLTSSGLERHIHHNLPTLDYGDLATIEPSAAQYVFIGPNDPNHPDRLDPMGQRALATARALPDRFELVRADSVQNWYIFRVRNEKKR